MNKLIFPNQDALAIAAAVWLVQLAETAIAGSGRFRIALAGGSTPVALYRLLARDEWAARLAWESVHFFFGDERCVPPDHPDSNYRLVMETLVDHVPIPENNVHRMPGEMEPGAGALAYERLLYREFNWKTPVFDLVLLGMGTDGHTASLFPGDASMLERRRWVVAVEHAQPPPPLVPRLTITFPVINFARNVLFMVSGDEKAGAVQQVHEKGDDLPAAMVSPVSGNLVWMLD